MTINQKLEFQRKLRENKLKSAPVYYNGKYEGEVDVDFNYTHENCLRYLRDKEYALSLAAAGLDEHIRNIKKLRSSETVTLRAVYHNKHSEWDYADKDGVVRHHVYPTEVDDKKTYDMTGTYDSIFEDMYRANNSLRYCNGRHHEFEDKAIQALYQLWHRTISYSRSFDLYYGNGIVD